MMIRLLTLLLTIVLRVQADDADTSTSSSIEAKRPWQPGVGEKWQIILNSTVSVSSDTLLEPEGVKVWEVDLFDTTKESINEMHKRDIKVICYFSGGTSEDWRPDFKSFDESDKGACLPKWVGERYIDIRKDGIFRVMKARIALAAEKGCDAIDPDNIDVFTNNAGFQPRLTKRDAVAYFKKLAREAASHGISTGLKNAQGMLNDVRDIIQFCVNEECADQRSCNSYRDFLSPRNRRGSFRIAKPVFHIEYTDESKRAGPVKKTKKKSAPTRRDETIAQAESAVQANRRRQCLVGDRSGGLFSTTIKNVNLDGWVYYCDGQNATTVMERAVVIKGLAGECKGG